MSRALTETAIRLPCSERTLRRYVNEGALRGERCSKGEVRLPYAEERYLVRHWRLLSGLRRALRTEHRVRLAVLFGSTATGEDRPDSDVDLLISHATGRPQEVVELRRRLQEHLERPLHLALLEDAERSSSLLADVLLEGRVVVDRDGIWPRLDSRKARVLRAAAAEEAAIDMTARSSIAAARERLAG